MVFIRACQRRFFADKHYLIYSECYIFWFGSFEMVKDQNYWENLINKAISGQTETNDLDFKANLAPQEKLNERLKEHLNAMGNMRYGGMLVFGIDTNCKPFRYTGDAISFSHIEQKIVNLAHTSQEPPLNTRTYTIRSDLGQLLCIHIHEGNKKPVFIKDRAPLGGVACYKRSGSHTLPMTVDEIRTLLAESARAYYDETQLDDVQIEDLDFEKIRELFSSFDASCPDLKNSPQNLSILVDHKIITGYGDQYRPTVAGYLVFGKTLSANRKFNSVTIEFQQFKDFTRAKPIKKVTISGNLPTQIKSAIDLLMQHQWTLPILKNGKRLEIPSYHPDIIREVVTNSLIHRDYTLMHQPVKIALFSDRVEVENPGGLLPGLTPWNLIHKRHWRNPTIATLIKKSGFGEMDGQGIDRIYALSRQAHLPMPIFNNDGLCFTAILSGPKPFEEWLPDQKRMSVIGLLIIEKNIDNDLIRDYFNITAAQATTLIKSMIESRIIEPISHSRKFAKYRLTSMYMQQIV